MSKHKISEAEWRVMEIIWNNENILASDIAIQLEKMNWNIQTIKTLLSRLVNKNIISYKKEGKAYCYYSILSREECIKKERENFIYKVFKGSKQEFLTNFIKDESFTKREIEELRKLINEKGEKSGIH